MRVLVARPVVARAAVEARVVRVRVARAEPAAQAVPVLTELRVWVRSVRRALRVAMVVRAVRAAMPGLAACVVMAVRVVPVVSVAAAVPPAQTRVRRDLRAGPAVPVVTRVLVVGRVVARAAAVRPAVLVWVVRAGPAAPVVPVLMALRVWVRSGRLGTPVVMVASVVRVVPPGLVGFGVMVARAVPVVSVAAAVPPAQTRVRRDLPVEPEARVVTPVPAAQPVPEWVRAAQPEAPVLAEPVARVARAVPVQTPRSARRAMREGLVVPAARVVTPELAVFWAAADSVGMAVPVAGVVPLGRAVVWALLAGPVALEAMRARAVLSAMVRAAVEARVVLASAAPVAPVAPVARVPTLRPGRRAMRVVLAAWAVKVVPRGLVVSGVMVVRAVSVDSAAAVESAVMPVGWALSAAPVVPVAMRVSVVRLVAEPVWEEPAEALVLAEPVVLGVPVVRVPMGLRGSGLPAGRDTGEAPAVPAARVVTPGLAGFAVMAVREAVVVLVVGEVSAGPPVRRASLAVPAASVARRVSVVRRAAARARAVRQGTPVPAGRVARVAPEVLAPTALWASRRQGRPVTRLELAVRVVRAVTPERVGCVAAAVPVATADTAAGVETAAPTSAPRASMAEPAGSAGWPAPAVRQAEVRARAVRRAAPVQAGRAAPGVVEARVRTVR